MEAKDLLSGLPLYVCIVLQHERCTQHLLVVRRKIVPINDSHHFATIGSLEAPVKDTGIISPKILQVSRLSITIDLLATFHIGVVVAWSGPTGGATRSGPAGGGAVGAYPTH